MEKPKRLCKPIRVTLDDVVSLVPDPVPQAIPSISLSPTDRGVIIATATQKTGNVNGGKKTTEARADALEPALKPENIIKGVTIFGVEGQSIGVDLQDKEITINKNGDTTVIPDADFNGLKKVDVHVQVEPKLQNVEKEITQNGTTTVKPDTGNDGLSQVVINTNVKPTLQKKWATENGPVEADPGYDGLSSVDVNVKPKLQTVPEITKNGPIELEPGNEGFAAPIDVNVEPTLQEKTVTQNGTVLPDEGYEGLSQVNVRVNQRPPLQVKTVTKNGVVKPDSKYYGLSAVNVKVKPNLQVLPEITESGIYEIEPDKDGFASPINVKVDDIIKVLYETQKYGTLEFNNTGTKDYISVSNCDIDKIIYNGLSKDPTRITFVGDKTYVNEMTCKMNSMHAFGNLFATGTIRTLKIDADIMSCTNINDPISNVSFKFLTFSFRRFPPYAPKFVRPLLKESDIPFQNPRDQYESVDNFFIVDIKNEFPVKLIQGARFVSFLTVDVLNYHPIDCISINYEKVDTPTGGHQTVIVESNGIQNLVLRADRLCPLNFAHTAKNVKKGIYVPDNLVNEYKAAENWSVFGDKIKPLSTLPPEYDYTKLQ